MVKYDEDVKAYCNPIDVGRFRIRYLLEIEIEKNNGGSAICVMMNPSRADMNETDDSVNGVIDFFSHKNYKTIKILNLIPFYVTDSSELRQLFDDFHKEEDKDKFIEVMDNNFATISRVMNEFENDVCVVLAWGNPPKKFDRKLYQEYIDKVLGFMETKSNINIFQTNNIHGELTKLGNPRHPSRNKRVDLLKINILKYRYIDLEHDESSNICNLTDAN